MHTIERTLHPMVGSLLVQIAFTHQKARRIQSLAIRTGRIASALITLGEQLHLIPPHTCLKAVLKSKLMRALCANQSA